LSQQDIVLEAYVHVVRTIHNAHARIMEAENSITLSNVNVPIALEWNSEK